MSEGELDMKELREAFERKATRYIVGLGGSMLFIGAAAGFLFKQVPNAETRSGVPSGLRALAAGTGLCLLASSAASITISKYYGISTMKELGNRIRGKPSV